MGFPSCVHRRDANVCLAGLDAFMALSVTRILLQQARGAKPPPADFHSSGKEKDERVGGQRGEDRRRLVMAVVHQPSSEIFELATHVLLLSKGAPLLSSRPCRVAVS